MKNAGDIQLTVGEVGGMTKAGFLQWIDLAGVSTGILKQPPTWKFTFIPRTVPATLEDTGQEQKKVLEVSWKSSFGMCMWECCC